MSTDDPDHIARGEALIRSEANLSAIIENTTDLVYSLDQDLKFITFNERFKQTVKQVYNLEVVQGKSALELVEALPDDMGEKWDVIYNRALKGETQQFVNEYPFQDSFVYLSYSVNPILQAGKVIGLSCFSRDITRQKLHETKLIESEANLRTIFENTDNAITFYDTALNILSYNAVANYLSIKMFGKRLRIGRSAYNYFPKRRWEAIKQALQLVKNNEVVNYEAIYYSKTGEKEWFETRWVGVRNHEKDLVGIILNIKNITEKKNTELERAKITTDLLRRVKDLEQFTYIISHNLRAPVANIKGLTEILELSRDEHTESSDTITALSQSIKNLDRVIIDLNDIVQDGYQINEHKEQISLSALVDEILLEISIIISKNNAQIRCHFEDANELFSVRNYVHSIFQNLIVNSIKYRQTGIDAVIDISSTIADQKMHIIFKDNGRGIDLVKYRSHLFGLYKRFDFSVEGKGMGLFMVKTQVESLGGTINVQSVPGEGTVFAIELPL